PEEKIGSRPDRRGRVGSKQSGPYRRGPGGSCSPVTTSRLQGAERRISGRNSGRVHRVVDELVKNECQKNAQGSCAVEGKMETRKDQVATGSLKRRRSRAMSGKLLKTLASFMIRAWVKTPSMRENSATAFCSG